MGSKFWAVFDSTIKYLYWLAAVLIFLSILLVSASVVSRYFLKAPVGWVQSVTEYSLLFIVFLGTAWVLKQDGHVKVSLLTDRLKPKRQATLKAVMSGMGTLACLACTWYGASVTQDYFQRGLLHESLLEPPKFALIIIIPIGSFLLSVQFLRMTWQAIHNLRA